MTQRYQVYKCMQCGNIIEVLHASGGELSCCGQPMRLLTENTTEAAVEKAHSVLTPATAWRPRSAPCCIRWKINTISSGSRY